MFQGNYGYAAGDREAFTLEDSSESARKTQPLPHEHTTKTRQLACYPAGAADDDNTTNLRHSSCHWNESDHGISYVPVWNFICALHAYSVSKSHDDHKNPWGFWNDKGTNTAMEFHICPYRCIPQVRQRMRIRHKYESRQETRKRTDMEFYMCP